MLDLTHLFKELEAPAACSGGTSQYTARSIPGYEAHRLARDYKGSPALLIAVNSSGGSPLLAPIHLEHLSVLHNAECVISREDGSEESGRFSVVRCIGSDAVLRSYFLRLVGSIVTLVGPEPSQADVSRAINKLVELFQAMAEPARKSVQGLWAELYVIAQAAEPVAMVRAWHATPFDIFDFNTGTQRLEVKSAGGSSRQHHFSLAQLQPLPDTQVVVASLLLERSGGGVSLAELIEEVRGRLADKPDLLVRIDEVVLSTLGESWRKAFDARFDREMAKKSLKFFDATVIPSVDLELPSTVTDVHFKSDLTGVQNLTRQQLRTIGGLFRAALASSK